MADNEFKYDVFISYSHKDEKWVVKTLLPALENAKLKVCIDYRDFDAGKPSIVNMEDAVEDSRHTVLVLTPNWTGSEWTDFESILTQTDNPAGRRQKLIPIMLEQCTPPKRVKSLTYVDFMRSDRLDNAWAQLFKTLGKPVPEKKKDLITASRADWCFKHPYAALPNFTGRVAERQMLTDWLKDREHPLLVLRALGGFGKSALPWHWLNNDLDPAAWPKVLWWSFYDERDFGSFVGETPEYLTGQPANPTATRLDVEALLNELEKPGILLVLDGFERALRAYSSMNAAYQEDTENKTGQVYDTDCVSILAEQFLKCISTLPELKGKALITTRLCPKIMCGHSGGLLEGCMEKELTALDKADAVDFFQHLGINGTRAEIEAACKPYGYHPLSLRLLAGLIIRDFEHPKDIEAAKKFNIIGDLKQKQHHVLEQSYNSLTPERQRLFSRIACFRGSIDYQAMQAVAEKPENFDADIHDLVERGLLHHDEKTNQFDLHPIVRRYAYERLTAPDRTAAHNRLVNYFEAVPEPPKVEKLEDLAPIIELYHHMVRAGNLDKAVKLLRERLVPNPLHYQFGAYQLMIELKRALFPVGEDKPPRLKKESDQAWTLSALASSYSLSGQPRRAVPLFEMHNAINEKAGNKENLTIGLVALVQVALLPIGMLKDAEHNLRRQIELCSETQDEFIEGADHQDFGRVLSHRGAWREAGQELDKSLELAEKQKHIKMQGLTWSYRALHFLLLARENRKLPIENLKSAIESAQHALELTEEDARTVSPMPRDFIRAYWLLGAAYRPNNELNLAEENLSKALDLCRQINAVDAEAEILLDVARLCYAQGDFKEAQQKASEALVITERSGYVLQGADVNLFLAQYALEQEQDKAKVKTYAETALKLAHCEDGPPYHYKVALRRRGNS